MKRMVKLAKNKIGYIIAGAVGALTIFVLDHYDHLIADVKTLVGGPIAGALFNFVLEKLKNTPAEEVTDKVDEYIEPENRKKIEDDAITANAQLEKQTQIQARIERLLGEIEGADRVIIHKFHNGGKFYTEQCTQKMAVVYQASRYKYYKIDNELNGGNFNLEKMGGILKKVVDKRYLHLTMDKDKDKYKHTPYYQILEDDGVEANHLRIIRSGRETYRNIGLLSIHFIKRKKKGLTVREIRLIDNAVNAIQLLLVNDNKGYPEHYHQI